MAGTSVDGIGAFFGQSQVPLCVRYDNPRLWNGVILGKQLNVLIYV